MKISIIEPGCLNLELALLFASKGHKVVYFCEFKESFPNGYREALGTGFEQEGVWRTRSLSEALEFAEVVVCPDTHSEDYLALAKAYGKPSWGSAHAERLESDRAWAKSRLKSLGLPVAPYESGIGLLDLENYLSANNDLYIKFPSSYRGIAETRHHYDWSKTKIEWWGQLLHDLGPLGASSASIPWVAESTLEHELELACDQLIVNGNYSTPTLVGIEDKDSAYIGKIFTTIPPLLEPQNLSLAPYFKTCSTKQFISLESMVTKDKKVYLTDPCIRTGHPVNATQLKIYSNLTDFIIKGAILNTCIPIKPCASYAIALEVRSTAIDDGFLEIQFNPKHRDNLVLQNCIKRGNKYYVIPKSFIVATIVTWGNSLALCESQLHTILKDLSVVDMFYDLSSIEKIKEKMKKGKELGIEF